MYFARLLAVRRCRAYFRIFCRQTVAVRAIAPAAGGYEERALRFFSPLPVRFLAFLPPPHDARWCVPFFLYRGEEIKKFILSASRPTLPLSTTPPLARRHYYRFNATQTRRHQTTISLYAGFRFQATQASQFAYAFLVPNGDAHKSFGASHARTRSEHDRVPSPPFPTLLPFRYRRAVCRLRFVRPSVWWRGGGVFDRLLLYA